MPATGAGARTQPGEALRLRLDTSTLLPGSGLTPLESVLNRMAQGSRAPLRVLEIAGDAPVWDSSGDVAEMALLLAWGERLAAEASRSGSLRVGWADGVLRGPALEILLACDLIALGPAARLVLFPPGEGYRPVAGGLTRALRRAGSTLLLSACLEAEPVTAGRAREIGLASAVLEREDLDEMVNTLGRSDPRALAAVADLARRGMGLGGRQAEALERALFSWCFAGGHPSLAIRAYRGREGEDA